MKKNDKFFEEFAKKHNFNLRDDFFSIEEKISGSKTQFSEALLDLDNVQLLSEVEVLELLPKDPSKDYNLNLLLENHFLEEYEDGGYFPYSLYCLLYNHFYLKETYLSRLNSSTAKIINSLLPSPSIKIQRMVDNNLKELNSSDPEVVLKRTISPKPTNLALWGIL